METPSSYEDTLVIPLDSDEPHSEAESEAEDTLESIDAAKFELFPTPPATLPAALLAASI